MFYAITIKDNTITAKHECTKPINEDTFINSPDFAGQAVVEVPGDKEIEAGRSLEEYDSDWNLKPLSQRVAEGIVVLPLGSKLDGENIIEMTDREKVEEGILQVEFGCVLDGDNIRAMTVEEKINASIATQEEIDAYNQAQNNLRIAELKGLLYNSDYKIIKCQECSLLGLPYPYDIQELYTQRQAWRDEINNIETT